MKKIIFAMLLLLCSCGNDDSPAEASGSSSPLSAFPGLSLAVFAQGFDSPVAVVSPRDGTGRLFVIEQKGVIKIIQNGRVLPTPFLDLSAKVKSGGEQGLLGLAFPPDFKNKKVFYVNYTNTSGVGNTVLARYSVGENGNVADATSAKTLLSITQPFTNHNGGQLAFGPDGFLYMATGDGGSAGDPFNNAQNKNSLLGKILRLDVESDLSAYHIPSGNPFNNEVWSYGLRNPWRFSFDRQSGELYIGDVGQDEKEEINVLASGAGGQNFGWNVMEGNSCYKASTCAREGLVLPVTEYTHANNECSVIGGYVYRGTKEPAMQGIYFYGDFCSGKIRGLKRSGTSWESQVLADTGAQISSFGEDEDGTLYFSDLGSGKIYRLSTAP